MLSDSPPERDLQWTDTGIAASFKFIKKLYDLIEKFKNYETSTKDNTEVIESLKLIINQVSEYIELFQFNKSVAKIYEYVNIVNNSVSKSKLSKRDFMWSLNRLSIILQPFIPHISEELWSSLGNQGLCIHENWIDENVSKKNKVKIAIQINGKTKQIIEIDDKLEKEKVLSIVKYNEKIKKIISSKKILREIYVPGKIVNLVL